MANFERYVEDYSGMRMAGEAPWGETDFVISPYDQGGDEREPSATEDLNAFVGAMEEQYGPDWKRNAERHQIYLSLAERARQERGAEYDYEAALGEPRGGSLSTTSPDGGHASPTAVDRPGSSDFADLEAGDRLLGTAYDTSDLGPLGGSRGIRWEPDQIRSNTIPLEGESYEDYLRWKAGSSRNWLGTGGDERRPGFDAPAYDVRPGDTVVGADPRGNPRVVGDTVVGSPGPTTGDTVVGSPTPQPGFRPIYVPGRGIVYVPGYDQGGRENGSFGAPKAERPEKVAYDWGGDAPKGNAHAYGRAMAHGGNAYGHDGPRPIVAPATQDSPIDRVAMGRPMRPAPRMMRARPMSMRRRFLAMPYHQGGDEPAFAYDGPDWDGSGADTWDYDKQALAGIEAVTKRGLNNLPTQYWSSLDDDTKDYWRSGWSYLGFSPRTMEHRILASGIGNDPSQSVAA
jgi:hypothetical protein